MLSDICKDVFSILENYDNLFGECHNKLRLILDFSSMCFKLTFLFVSDGSFQQKLKADVLVKAGERAAHQIMDDESYEPPFSLQRKSQI